ncbi:7SK snRNA methylphosphate capping enzyme bin3-like [Culicoides brevitarsis]|uniref:7SK snRNA methylphosphate capping enzyme bin3-like n=1 Tax=Culicoides brevitarsis TaxID=469753 RepID=UPI00307C874A
MADPGGTDVAIEAQSSTAVTSDKETDKKFPSEKQKKNHNNKKQQHNKKWKGGKFKRYNKQRQQNNKVEANQSTEAPASTNTQSRKHGHCHAKPPYNKRIQLAFSTVSKFFLPEKLPRKARVIPPTKFLLGGNISDPLNLNSLQNESENAVTPKSSPIPTPPHGRQPVEVLIPPNIRDPLHLLDPVDSVEYEMQLCSPMKRKTNKNRHRKRRKSCKENNNGEVEQLANTSTQSDPGSKAGNLLEKSTADSSTASITMNTSSIEGDVPSTSNLSAEPESRSSATKNLRLELGIEPPPVGSGGRKRRCSESSTGKSKSRRVDMDKIVSPVIPQHHNTWKRPHKSTSKPQRNRTRSYSRSTTEETTAKALTEQMKIDENAQGMSPAEAIQAESHPQTEEQSESQTTRPETKSKSAKYQYGNYDRYYGYRHLNEFMDVRLKVFLKNPQLFKEKDVLDIGCNVGLLTIEAGKELHPKSIIGLDIDKNLISRARKNLSMYVRVPGSDAKKAENPQEETAKEENSSKKPQKGGKNSNRRYNRRNSRYDKSKHRQDLAGNSEAKAQFFPMSFPLCLGRIPKSVAEVETMPDDAASPAFPDNVFFRTANYVPKDENQLSAETQQYDLILCLSVTKWIHLNFGDAGLKLAFKRMFNQLRPGGKLILEAQNWASYKKKKNVSETVKENYAAIRFFPKKFNEYLLSSEVGFSHSYPLGIPRHLNKGFSRPIQLFVKGEFTPSHAQWSDYHFSQTPYQTPKSDPAKNKYYTNLLYGNSTPYASHGSYSYRMTDPSPYYNPLATDSYLPSYDNETTSRAYCFASPLYSTTWSPPPNSRSNSLQNTPAHGSIRNAEIDDGYNNSRPHVYPPSTTDDFEAGKLSSRSVDNSDEVSPQHVYSDPTLSDEKEDSRSPKPTNGIDYPTMEPVAALEPIGIVALPEQNGIDTNHHPPQNHYEDQNHVDDAFS